LIKMKKIILLQKKLFLKKFEKTIERLIKKLDDYINDPNEDNIHDIRIAIRRMEAAHRILPRNLRKDDTIQTYVTQAKVFFKINTRIRDFDVICAKLENQHQGHFSDIINSLKNERKAQLNTAHRSALKLKQLPLPTLKRKDLDESKLQKRYQKIVTKFIAEIKGNIPIVLSDDKKVEDLHKLRKDFKKLRYSIELSSDETDSFKSLKSLKKIQDQLGTIHDSDMMLDYLRDTHGPIELAELVRKEILERREKYQKFVRVFKDENLDPQDLVL
jgi:CHAD domain-containing protein